MVTSYDIILLKSHFQMDTYTYMIKKKQDKIIGKSMHALWQVTNISIFGSDTLYC